MRVCLCLCVDGLSVSTSLTARPSALPLKRYNQIGCYLLRNKDKHGSEFVYSYLSVGNKVNHAKVLIKGRTYVIDGETGPLHFDDQQLRLGLRQTRFALHSLE
jgi:hypothetical protein